MVKGAEVMNEDLMIDILKMFPDIYEMIEFLAKLITGEENADLNDCVFLSRISKYKKYGILDFFEKIKGKM